MESRGFSKVLLSVLLLLLGEFFLLISCATDNQDVISLQLVSKSWHSSELNWTGYDPCGESWRGIRCNGTSVTELISNRGDLSGTLAPNVGSLISLKILDLSFNPNLGGPIPVELGKLTKLVRLSLQGCSFTGSIPPQLGQLKNLVFLALNMNKLTGSIPAELGGLASVTWFDVAENGLTGTLPASSLSSGNIGLNNLTKAVHFHLFNNSFTGSLPKEYATLPALRHLMVDNNRLNGSIPPEYGSFKALEILRVDNNNVGGTVPETISQVKPLQELYITNNSFTGVLPDLSNFTQLMLLKVGNNVFDPQPIGASILNMKTLQTLEMDQANLNGTFPNEIFQLPLLESLSVASNRLTGAVNFTSAPPGLKYVNLDQNSLTQVIGIGGQFNLSLIGNPVCQDPRYHLSDQVCQPITMQTWNSTNQTCALNCTNGELLNIYFCSCAVPLVIFFQFNSPTFSDITPERINDVRVAVSVQNIVALDQVSVPAAFWMTNHRLYVAVYIFPNKTQVQMVYEEAQRLLNRIALHLNASFPVEFGPYSVSSASLFLLGNLKSSKASLGAGAIAGITIGTLVALIGVGAVAFYALFQKRRADKALSMPFTSWGSIGKSGSAPILKGARYFSLHELKKVTNNFSSSNEVGSGGYGKVYKGVLVSGEAVAIKKAEEGSMQGSHEFKTEIEHLSRVHHKNLVNLIGFCYEQGAQMLVYEYMANGSLKDYLAGDSGRLNWQKRVEIALDAAKGLTYLHELASPPIIHRDIKSGNILLSELMVAKVADFGLGKLGINEEMTHVSTQVKGTLGYMDPEYYMTQQLTEKSDVYSFGVVLLELLTARQPIVRGKYIVREVRTALDRGGLSALCSLLDRNLEDAPESDLMKFVDLALQCVEETSAHRPTMNQVVKELEILLANITGSVVENGNGADRHPSGLYDDAAMLSGATDDPEFAYSGVFQSRVIPK